MKLTRTNPRIQLPYAIASFALALLLISNKAFGVECPGLLGFTQDSVAKDKFHTFAVSHDDRHRAQLNGMLIVRIGQFIENETGRCVSPVRGKCLSNANCGYGAECVQLTLNGGTQLSAVNIGGHPYEEYGYCDCLKNWKRNEDDGGLTCQKQEHLEDDEKMAN